MANEEKAWEHIIRVPEVGLDYSRAALVVIDLQNLFASRTFGLFRRLADGGLGAEAEYAISRIETLVVPNVKRLTDAFRSAGRPVVYCRCASLIGDGSDQTARHRAQGLICPAWEHGAQILDEIAPQRGDVVLTKSGSGCFTSTHLDHLLRNAKVDGIVLTGMWTNSCVETTARHAGDLDYQVAIVEDACVAMTPENHAWALQYLGNNFALVHSTDTVVASVESASGIDAEVGLVS